MKDKILTICFVGFISVMGILGILLPDEKISKTERRRLATFPEFEFSSEYISKVEKYLLDQAAFRDGFRSIKASYNYNVLRKLDNNGIYLKDNYIFKTNYPTNKKSIDNFRKKISKLSDLCSDENDIYMAIIPDKNYYLKDKDFLQLDYEFIYKEMDNIQAEKIDLREVLNLSSYYETDTHWKQENLSLVVQEMDKVIGFIDRDVYYQENKYNDFYGVYYGEAAIKRKPEMLTYLSSEEIEKSRVKYLENADFTSVYNTDKLKGMDAYNVYLDGASSFIEITNTLRDDQKELIVFRDSFGSSLAPLLIPYYSKITVIDNRYISSDNFKNMIEFKNQDVLFLYSTLLVNNSFSLKG